MAFQPNLRPNKNRYRRLQKTIGSRRRHARGFTLLELLVVTALIAIVLGLASLSLRGAEARQLREEAQRLAALVQLASDASALDGRVLALSFSERNYEFLRRDRTGE